MTYIPILPSTGVVSVDSYYGHATSTNETPVALLNFNVVRDQTIGVRLFVKTSKPYTGGTYGNGRIIFSEHTLNTSNWADFANQQLYVSNSAFSTYSAGASWFAEPWGPSAFNIPVNNDTADRRWSLNYGYMTAGYSPRIGFTNNPLTVYAGGGSPTGTAPSYYCTALVLVYNKS